MKWIFRGMVLWLLVSPARAQSTSDSSRALQLADEGKLEEAETAFAALDRDGALPLTLLDRAVDVSTRLNHWDRVVSLLLKARESGPLTVQRRIQLYEARLRQGNPKAAETELRGLVRDRPGDQRLVHLLAFLFLSQQRFQEAAGLYRAFIHANPSAFESRINLALVDFKLNQADEALVQLKSAFQSGGSEANEYFYRQLARNMAPEGLADLARDTKRALGLPDDGARTHLLLGREFENLARGSNAIEEYESYLAAEPDDLDVLYRLARLYFQAGRGDACEKALRRLLKEDGAIGDSARLLAAELAVKSDRMDEAAVLLAKLPASFQDSNLYRFLSARVAVGRGDLARAAELLTTVIKRDPEMTEAYFHLGQVYLRLGQAEKGRQALAEFQKRKKR